jgi:heme-degrading monooxygenase HmoA
VIRHIVLWRLKAPAAGEEREAVFARIKAALEAQAGRIPGLFRLEAGLNFSASRRAVDFALVSEFESREALAAYHRHPAHAETRAIVDPLVAEHWIVDYEI